MGLYCPAHCRRLRPRLQAKPRPAREEVANNPQQARVAVDVVADAVLAAGLVVVPLQRKRLSASLSRVKYRTMFP